MNLADGSFWIYEYDALGQVKSGKRYWSDWTPVAGQSFEYGFDDIGNRNTAKAGGDENGADLRSTTYTVNNLNQYSQRTVPGYADINGLVLATNSVTVNGSAADYRRGEYFQELLTVVNSSTSVWQTVSVTNTGGGSTTGSVFVAKTPETFGYDADGNTTNDGRWTLTWDGENRLVNLTSLNTTPSASRLKLDFAYDGKGRRIQKIVSAWNGSAYVAQSTNRFVYDGWNLVAELNNVNGLIRSYVWGLDLSGNEQGAGGVGGLLQVAYYGAQTTNCFAAYDGNGNLTALVNAADGSVFATYEYDPFGQTIRATGPMAKADPFRFSTKYQDDETDWVYYGYRYLRDGRWLSRDPIEEIDNPNLYSFVGNVPVSSYDIHGLLGCSRDPCADPCGDAERQKIDYGDVGGIVCCNGTAHVCVWRSGGLSGASSKAAKTIIDKCSRAHENDHRPTVTCPPGNMLTHGGEPDPVKRKQGECQAYRAQMACLRSSIGACDGNPTCITEVLAEMKEARGKIKENCP